MRDRALASNLATSIVHTLVGVNTGIAWAKDSVIFAVISVIALFLGLWVNFELASEVAEEVGDEEDDKQ